MYVIKPGQWSLFYPYPTSPALLNYPKKIECYRLTLCLFKERQQKEDGMESGSDRGRSRSQTQRRHDMSVARPESKCGSKGALSDLVQTVVHEQEAWPYGFTKAGVFSIPAGVSKRGHRHAMKDGGPSKSVRSRRTGWMDEGQRSSKEGRNTERTLERTWTKSDFLLWLLNLSTTHKRSIRYSR